MTVFKGYLLIIRKNIMTMLMYIFIFSGIAIAIQSTYQTMGLQNGFATVKLKTAVIDRDGGPLSDALKQMLSRDQTLVDLEDEASVIQEELYYSNVEYIVIVAENAEEKLLNGENVIESIAVPGTASAYYLQARVNNFLNQIRVCQSGGFSMAEACEIVLDANAHTSNVVLEDVNGNAGIRKSYNFYFTYMPYAFLGASVMTIGTIIMEFKKKGIRQRLQSSPAPFWKQNFAMAAAFMTVGLFTYGVCIIIQTFLYKGGIFTDGHVGLYLLNSFLFLLTSLSLGFLVGTISSSSIALNALNNIVSLGLCFLGGIFVPLDMMGSKIQQISQFLPTYWYSTVNGLLGDYLELSSSMQEVIAKGLLIQILFAAACFALTLMIRKKGQFMSDI